LTEEGVVEVAVNVAAINGWVFLALMAYMYLKTRRKKRKR
jgi:hypothetical protein